MSCNGNEISKHILGCQVDVYVEVTLTLCMLWTVKKAVLSIQGMTNSETYKLMLSEVCQDIEIDPQLQPLTGENMSLQSANTEDSAHLDVKARGFSRQGQYAFFDIRVAHLNAKSNRALLTDQILCCAESKKKRSYNQRVTEIEHGTFMPLIFGINGAIGT